MTAKLLDSKIWNVYLNDVPQFFTSQTAGRIPAVVAKASYHRATENKNPKRHAHSVESHPSNNIIKILLDSGSNGDLMYLEKGTSMNFPT